MRTNDKLVNEAFRYKSATTKRELLKIVLKEFVERYKRADIRYFKQKITIAPDYNY
jgi:hypothetical protein